MKEFRLEESFGPAVWESFCIHEIFENRAERSPEAVAVRCGEEELNYRQLNQRANQLARYLKTCGVGPETPVALCLERSLDLVVAILAVLKASGAYVPLDVAYPKERLGFMLEDSEAPVILTQKNLLTSLPASDATVICLDTDWDKIAGQSVENLEVETTPDNAAYIIFTSGSTGKPKGVVVTHSNVVRLFTQTNQWYGFNSNDVWALFHSYAFDMSVWELWGALFFGGRLVVVSYEVSRSPERFYELLGREGVTVLNQTPSAFRPLIWAEANATIKQPLALRWITFGGEALELQSLKPWFEAHGDKMPQLVNKYGITETTVHSTYRPISAADLTTGQGSVIGIPIPDLTIHLLDENLKPVPPGAPGEIFVGGAGVARGYLKRPELTAQRFIPDPFSDKPGARLYRSGDLARRLENGELEYLGRIDHQIKIRGFRIELGEIEATLNQHPSVRESVVIGSGHEGGDKRLIAYVVPVKEAPSVSDLREHAGRKLPDYMIPAQFVFLACLPLTPNGKIDRRALPAPDKVRPVLSTAYAEPQTAAERGLAKIWSRVLEIEPIGLNDSFFELGGDSIRCITLLAQARQCGFNFSLQDLFERPTIAALTRCLASSADMLPPIITEPFSLIKAQDREKLPPELEDAYPMLMLQAGMFFHNDLNPASAIFHDVFSFRIQFPFVLEKLERAIAQLVARHPSLRTSFDLGHFSEPLQLVHATASVPLSVEDLRHQVASEQEKALDAYIDAERYRPLNRTRAPLLRAAVQRCTEDVFQLIVSFHHAVLDGWSLAAFLTELLHDYSVLIKGTGKPIEPPKIGYCEYVALERKAISSEACRHFWTQKVQDLPGQRIPRWPKSLRAGGTEQVRGPEIQISAKVFEGLKDLAQKNGTPLKSVLQAAHFRVLNLLHGTSDVVSGLVTNGRPEEVDGERLIGLSLNTIPMRAQLKGGTWSELVRQMFEAERELLPFRRFPLIEIQKLAGGASLFECAFDFVHFHVYKDLQGYQDMGFLEGHYAEANSFALFTTFMLDVTRTQLQMHCDYDPEELCLEQIELIDGYYIKILEAMATEHDARYEKFSPLSEIERNRLLTEWNATQKAFLTPQTIHGLFEAQVERTPDAVAVIDGTREMTYWDLNRKANHLAHHLVQLGVGPEVLVGICVDRSLSMVIGLLGILKAGGAYVPLDPNYPKERLDFILHDTCAPVLLAKKTVIDKLPEHSAQVVYLDEPFDRAHSENVNSAVTENNVAYIIYTSGSTGRPKGVAIEHRNTAALLNWAHEVFSSEELSGVLSATSICFDLSVFELFVPLTRGGKIILAENVLQLTELPAAGQVTLINTVPSVMAELLRLDVIPASVRTVNLAGEPLQTTLVQQIHKQKTIGKVYDLYGPSEDTTYSTCALRDPEGPATIGRPLLNKRVYLLDENRQPVPVGVIGEIYIGGEGVARGYLKRPELTAEKFVDDPFCPSPGARLYRTGDLARYRLDGNIEFLGRMDHQVKIRGFRIELGEIESVLTRHPGVSEAVVLAKEEASGRLQLVAYLVARPNVALSFSQLRNDMKTSLPDYMIPTGFVFLQALPLTPNGKIDRKALPKPHFEAEPKNCVVPGTPEETALAQIWCEVLGLKQVGVHDNFFELGGHSLFVTQVISRAHGRGLCAITLKDIFEKPTIADLAKLLTDSNSGKSMLATSSPLTKKSRTLSKQMK